MAVFGDSECYRLNDFEVAGLETFSYLYEPLCDRLGTVSLFVRNTPDGKWIDEYGRTVAGVTWCDLSTVEVADTHYQTNAYFHELAHVAQCPAQDGSHAGWQELGIWAHLEALKASPVGLEKQGPDDISDGDAP